MPSSNKSSARMFSTSAMRGATMASNVKTTRNQGGGSKKAGFPYMIGRIYNIAELNKMNQPLSAWAITPVGKMNVKQSRPIGISPSPNAYNPQ